MLIKKSSTAYPLVFFMTDNTDHITGKTGLSPTVTLSKAGGSFASPSGSVTEIANGFYKVAGNATDSNTDGVLALHATGTGADPTDMLYEVVEFDPQDAVRLGLSTLPNAAAEASGGLPTLSAAQASNGTIQSNVHRWLTGTPNALQSGRIDAYLGAVATGVIVAASFAAGALDAVWSTTTRTLTAATNITSGIATAVWAELTSGMSTVGSIGKKLADWVLGSDSKVLISTDAQDLSATLDVNAKKLNGTTPNNISSSDVTAAVPTVVQIRTEIDTNSTQLTSIQADVDDIQTRIPTTLDGGKMRSQVKGMDTDVLDAAALKADAVTEIQAGLATSSAVSSIAATVSNINTIVILLQKYEKNLKKFVFETPTWYLVVYDNDDITPILKQEMETYDNVPIASLVGTDTPSRRGRTIV